MSKNVFVIVRAKTGKLISENERLPIFWYKKYADHRAKDFIGVKVISINEKELIKLLTHTTNEH